MFPTEKISVIKEQLMPSGRTVGCIDDRKFLNLEVKNPALEKILVTSREKGPQLLGGSLALMPVLVETAIELGIEPDIDLITDVIFEAHKNLGMEVTVHMHDHHNEWTGYRIIELIRKVLAKDKFAKIPGCGFAGLLANKENPLGLSEKAAEFFQKHDDLVERFVRKGARLIVLEGDHGKPGEVLAVRNNKRKFTLDIVGAHKNKVPAYNHDDWFYEDLVGRCVEGLQGQGQADWAQGLNNKARDLNDGWLKKTTMILANMKPIGLN